MGRTIKQRDIAYVFFCLLLFFLPFNTRKIILSSYSFFSGQYNEYVTYSIYFTDIIFILMLIFWLKQNGLRLLHSSDKRDKRILGLFAMFIFWITASSVANWKYIDISGYQLIRMIEAVLVCVITASVLNSKKRLIIALVIISIAGFMQAIIAITQFLNGGNVFVNETMRKLIGESLFSSNVLGTANFVYENVRIIRPYGTFPHPNMLAGFLLIAISASIAVARNRDYIYNEYNIKVKKSQLIDIGLLTFIVSEIASLILTFSRTAIITFIVSGILYLIFRKNVSRGTSYKRNILNNKYGISVILLIILYLIGNVSLITESMFATRWLVLNVRNQAVEERIMLQNVSRETILKNPLFGVGIGDYVLNMKDNVERSIEYAWEYQPDHDMYLLIGAEIGFVGLMILLSIVSNVSRETIPYKSNLKLQIKLMILSIFVIAIFDHYFWTMNQTRILMFVVIGMYWSLRKIDLVGIK